MYNRFRDLPSHLKAFFALNFFFYGLFRASILFVVIFTVGDYLRANGHLPAVLARQYTRLSELPFLRSAILIALIAALLWKGLLWVLGRSQKSPAPYRATPVSRLSREEQDEIMRAARRAMQASLGHQQNYQQPQVSIPRTISAIALQERYLTLFSRFQFMGQLLGRLHEGNEQQQLQELRRETELLLESLKDLQQSPKKSSSMKVMTIGDMIASLNGHYSSEKFRLMPAEDMSGTSDEKAISLSEANCVESTLKLLTGYGNGTCLYKITVEDSSLLVQFILEDIPADGTGELEDKIREKGLDQLIEYHGGKVTPQIQNGKAAVLLQFLRG